MPEWRQSQIPQFHEFPHLWPISTLLWKNLNMRWRPRTVCHSHPVLFFAMFGGYLCFNSQKTSDFEYDIDINSILKNLYLSASVQLPYWRIAFIVYTGCAVRVDDLSCIPWPVLVDWFMKLA